MLFTITIEIETGNGLITEVRELWHDREKAVARIEELNERAGVGRYQLGCMPTQDEPKLDVVICGNRFRQIYDSGPCVRPYHYVYIPMEEEERSQFAPNIPIGHACWRIKVLK